MLENSSFNLLNLSWVSFPDIFPIITIVSAGMAATTGVGSNFTMAIVT